MIINYLNDLEIPDETFDEMTPEELELWLEDWCLTNLGRFESVSVCPLTDGHIAFSVPTDRETYWREKHGSG